MERLLKESEVCEIVTFQRLTLLKMVEAGEFPKPILIRNKRRWWESDIQKWFKELKVVN